ncbi:MAG: murein biosynthesis integral membrane protein MurJ [Solirubrobacterales bacterium]|nr:murein biosynthesis integral membrane protein MurJ [Solirubrobacterales bacterium]
MPTQNLSPQPTAPEPGHKAQGPLLSWLVKTRGVGANTVIFSIATGASRLLGLARDILASSYFGTSGAFSAFTIAFSVPNLLRQLVADQAITSAFVPVFTQLIDEKRRAEAVRLASTFFFLIVAVLGSITALFILLAPVIMPLLTGSAFDGALDDLVSGLSQVLFPIVVLLGLNGLCVGILHAYDHFTIPAITPVVWNLVIIAVLVLTRPLFSGDDEMYAYAIGVLAGTIVQFAMAFPVLRAYNFHFEFKINLRDPLIGRVLRLMLPVTISLGLINFGLVINAIFGSLVSDQAPSAIDRAFRIYMLPQGMFSVAITTVLFPTLARLAGRSDIDGLRRATAGGLRQISLLLIPSAAFTLVLAEPITRLVFQRGAFGPESTVLVTSALFWFSFSLPLNGLNLLLTRTFFSLERPWLPTALAGANVIANVVVALALYEPFGIAGIVIGTTVGNLVMLVGQIIVARRTLGGIEGRQVSIVVVKVLIASAALAGAAYGVWYLLDGALGTSLIAQMISVGSAVVAGVGIYAVAIHILRVEEAHQIREMVARKFSRGTA